MQEPVHPAGGADCGEALAAWQGFGFLLSAIVATIAIACFYYPTVHMSVLSSPTMQPHHDPT